METPKLILPDLPHIHLSLFVNAPVLFGILILFFAFYVTVSSVLMYHWSAYGMRSSGILVGETLFLFVSVVLFVISVLSIHYF